MSAAVSCTKNTTIGGEPPIGFCGMHKTLSFPPVRPGVTWSLIPPRDFAGHWSLPLAFEFCRV